MVEPKEHVERVISEKQARAGLSGRLGGIRVGLMQVGLLGKLEKLLDEVVDEGFQLLRVLVGEVHPVCLEFDEILDVFEDIGVIHSELEDVVSFARLELVFFNLRQ